MKIGFVGLGNLGRHLAASLHRNEFTLAVHDIDREAAASLVGSGVRFVGAVDQLAAECDLLITCLPNPEASAQVMETAFTTIRAGTIWCEMSTTSEAEVKRLAVLAAERGLEVADCPVSGGCHRAASGNISILVGCERPLFERLLPLMSAMGRKILHTGPLGSASILKVVTNYLATANLVSLCEALTVTKLGGLDLRTVYEAIRISSGNSFVHETESQVILNGSRNINFTMDLVAKDIGIFDDLAKRLGAELEISPMLVAIFQDAIERYGGREWSPNVIRRLEDACQTRIAAEGFPAEITDDEPEAQGAEIIP